MATPTFRGVGAVANGSPGATALGVIAPTCFAGDLLVAVLATSFTAPTPPAGWIQVASTSVSAPGGGMKVRIFTKHATAADSGASFTFTIGASSGSRATAGRIIAYQNAFGVEQVEYNGSTLHNFEDSPEVQNAAAVTTERANQLVLEVFACQPGDLPYEGSYTATPSTTRGTPQDSAVNRVALAVAEQPQTVPGTTTAKTATFSRGSFWVTVTFSIYPNDAPNAPTLNVPVNTEIVNVNNSQGFNWTFQDPDPGDSQSKYELRYSDDAGATWTTITATTPSNAVFFPGGTFEDGVEYEWQVRTWDSFGEVSPWSASSHFTGAAPPEGPTILNPLSDETVDEAHVDVEWSFTDQEGYQVRLWPDDSGDPDESGDPLFDTGQVLDTITHQVTVPLPDNSTTRHAQVSIKSGGLWSDFVDVRFSVAYDPPPAPVVALTTSTSTITAQITTGEPDEGESPAIYTDLEISDDGGVTWTRVATELPINSQWTFWTPASGVNYLFRATTYAASGTHTPSEWVDEAVIDMGTPAAVPPLVEEGGP